MTQKRVSYEVAKTLNEVGYPQKGTPYQYVSKDYSTFKEGEAIDSFFSVHAGNNVIDIPTYLDAWLWLWREKEIRILLEDAKDPKEPEIERGCYVGTNQLGGMCSSQEFADPEDAIVDIIDYLVENKLLK